MDLFSPDCCSCSECLVYTDNFDNPESVPDEDHWEIMNGSVARVDLTGGTNTYTFTRMYNNNRMRLNTPTRTTQQAIVEGYFHDSTSDGFSLLTNYLDDNNYNKTRVSFDTTLNGFKLEVIQRYGGTNTTIFSAEYLQDISPSTQVDINNLIDAGAFQDYRKAKLTARTKNDRLVVWLDIVFDRIENNPLGGPAIDVEYTRTASEIIDLPNIINDYRIGVATDTSTGAKPTYIDYFEMGGRGEYDNTENPFCRKDPIWSAISYDNTDEDALTMMDYLDPFDQTGGWWEFVETEELVTEKSGQIVAYFGYVARDNVTIDDGTGTFIHYEEPKRGRVTFAGTDSNNYLCVDLYQHELIETTPTPGTLQYFDENGTDAATYTHTLSLISVSGGTDTVLWSTYIGEFFSGVWYGWGDTTITWGDGNVNISMVLNGPATDIDHDETVTIPADRQIGFYHETPSPTTHSKPRSEEINLLKIEVTPEPGDTLSEYPNV